jgi:hypothetical protein
MKYIFITEKEEYELLHGITLQNSVFFKIQEFPVEWSTKFLTKKAYNDVYSRKARFDDELTGVTLKRLYNIILVLEYIISNNIDGAIVIEDVPKFYKIYNNMKGFQIDNVDVLFLQDSVIPDSHFNGNGVYRQNQFVSKKGPAFYINFAFAKMLLQSQTKFYKPFEFTLNDYTNKAKMFTLFDSEKSEHEKKHRKSYSIYLNRYYIFFTVLILFYLIYFITK